MQHDPHVALMLKWNVPGEIADIPPIPEDPEENEDYEITNLVGASIQGGKKVIKPDNEKSSSETDDSNDDDDNSGDDAGDDGNKASKDGKDDGLDEFDEDSSSGESMVSTFKGTKGKNRRNSPIQTRRSIGKQPRSKPSVLDDTDEEEYYGKDEKSSKKQQKSSSVRSRDSAILALPSYRSEHPDEIEERKRQLELEKTEKKRKKAPVTPEQKEELKRRKLEREKLKKEENERRQDLRQKTMKENKKLKQMEELATATIKEYGLDVLKENADKEEWRVESANIMNKAFKKSKAKMNVLKEQMENDPTELDNVIQALKFVKGHSKYNCPENSANFRCKWKDEKGNIIEGWKYSYYKGITRQGQENVDQINPLWVEDVFEMTFVYMVQKLAPKIVSVPIGNSVLSTEPLPKYLKIPNVQTPYKQEDTDFCLAYCVASGLRHIGFARKAKELSQQAAKYANMPGRAALLEIAKDVQKLCPVIGHYEAFNVRRRGKSMRTMTKEALISHKSPYLTLVLPIAKDGSTDHAICVVDDIIYDARVEHGLKLKMATLDWVCGIGGCEELGPVYFFNKWWKTGKKYKRKKICKVEKHW